MGALSIYRLRWQEIVFALIPAIAFAALGLYDIGSELFAGQLSWQHVLFNSVFLLPIIFRSRRVYLYCGIICSLLWLFVLVSGIIEVPHTPGISPMEQIGAFLLIGFFFLCSLSLLYVAFLFY